AIKQILLTLEGSIILSYPQSGAAGDAGFSWVGWQDSSDWVLGKNQNAGTSIPAGSCGNLVNIEYINTPVSISVEIKDENDTIIDFSAYFDSGCSEESACNYNPYSVNDVDGACVYMDECGGNELDIINQGLIPETYNIYNIYPNPFNPVTNIEFGLPENSFVQILVYDIKGRHITTLMNSFQFAGYYSLTWDASDSPSGVYFINMTSDGFKQTRQVVLMK
ncbi:MAG: T9SS type A sorting domain-containing protein, partial [Candidatus Marinimicrobia bacterium]|nr:T9SS type A sorting domain-containing protein [Candidatus Neomarinimicrobiota bacterium]